ncbi:hypothetical protein [Paenirhodobacter populi]|uniref:hypothetical protein n=1 Tax=Paenirhodobacter populi TaxID=2306993 RepID=UPI0013E2F6F2|nr:hypothetical protein [Sinirhodobacter populi]
MDVFLHPIYQPTVEKTDLKGLGDFLPRQCAPGKTPVFSANPGGEMPYSAAGGGAGSQ